MTHLHHSRGVTIQPLHFTPFLTFHESFLIQSDTVFSLTLTHSEIHSHPLGEKKNEFAYLLTTMSKISPIYIPISIGKKKSRVRCSEVHHRFMIEGLPAFVPGNSLPSSLQPVDLHAGLVYSGVCVKAVQVPYHLQSLSPLAQRTFHLPAASAKNHG